MENFGHIYILFLGCAAIAFSLIHSFLKKTGWSPIPFYIVLGLCARFSTDTLESNIEPFKELISVFSDIGLVLILFQVGVQSNLKELLRQLKNAIFISIPEIFFSMILMFVAFYYFIGLSIETASIFSIAFSATSIAICLSLWKEFGLLQKPPGQLVTDLSAMDDIVGILLMVISFTFFKDLTYNSNISFQSIFFTSFLVTILKLLFFVFTAYAFSIYIEPKLSKFIEKYEIGPDPVITIISLALIFSALVDFSGLSIPLGAFLIGLSFSRDSSTVKLLTTYQSLVAFFTPFFFFSIGFSVSNLVSVSLGVVCLLFMFACLGKIIGVAIPSYYIKFSFKESMILGISMVPRAEVSLAVIGYANSVFKVPAKIYSESIIAILLTCLFPLILRPIIKKHSLN